MVETMTVKEFTALPADEQNAIIAQKVKGLRVSEVAQQFDAGHGNIGERIVYVYRDGDGYKEVPTHSPHLGRAALKAIGFLCEEG